MRLMSPSNAWRLAMHVRPMRLMSPYAHVPSADQQNCMAGRHGVWAQNHAHATQHPLAQQALFTGEATLQLENLVLAGGCAAYIPLNPARGFGW
jgi:hypothetical protein